MGAGINGDSSPSRLEARVANRFSRDRPMDRETRLHRSTLLLRCTTIAASIVAAVWLYGQAIQV